MKMILMLNKKKQEYSKADKHDIEILSNTIKQFAEAMGDTEEGVKTQLGNHRLQKNKRC